MPKIISVKEKNSLRKAFSLWKKDRPDLSETEIVRRLANIWDVSKDLH